jgi:hypothetical protein
MLINKTADTQIIRDIEDMFQMVELEASLFKVEYVPKSKKNETKLKEIRAKVIEFKAEKYREWIYRKAPKYADDHPYLHFQFARIVTLKDESVVQVMTRLRRDFDKVSLAARASYAIEAQETVRDYKASMIAKKVLH